jgi:hypothetical protein
MSSSEKNDIERVNNLASSAKDDAPRITKKEWDEFACIYKNINDSFTKHNELKTGNPRQQQKLESLIETYKANLQSERSKLEKSLKDRDKRRLQDSKVIAEKKQN